MVGLLQKSSVIKALLQTLDVSHFMCLHVAVREANRSFWVGHIVVHAVFPICHSVLPVLIFD